MYFILYDIKFQINSDTKQRTTKGNHSVNLWSPCAKLSAEIVFNGDCPFVNFETGR